MSESASPAKLAVTIQDAAVVCGVSVDTVRRAVADGSLPARYPTSRPVILVSDLTAWLEAATEKPRRTA